MTSIPSSYAPFRNVERHYTKTETGGQIDFERQLRNGSSITGTTTITQNDDGSATVNVSRTGPNGQTKTVEKSFSADQLAAFEQKLHQLGEKLAENPVTLPNGRVADGSFLLKITA